MQRWTSRFVALPVAFTLNSTEDKICQSMGWNDGSNSSGRCSNLLISNNPAKSGLCYSNPESAACISYCQRGDTDCNDVYKQFCQVSMNDSQAINHDVCGCFMSDAFYANYNKSLTDIGLGALLGGEGANPPCNYARCSSSKSITPFTYKSKTCPGLNVAACVSNIQIDNSGVIEGGLDAGSKQACGVNNTSTSASDTLGTIVTTLENNPLYVGIGIAILLFIIIISVTVHAHSKHRKKHGKNHIVIKKHRHQ